MTPSIEIDIPVRWGDMDALGHVNNTQFLRYIEEARLAWFAQIDDEWFNDDWGPVVANINCNFRRPIVWPATVRVKVEAEPPTGKSLRLRTTMVDADQPEVVYSDAEAVLVWIDRRSGSATPLPDWLNG